MKSKFVFNLVKLCALIHTLGFHFLEFPVVLAEENRENTENWENVEQYCELKKDEEQKRSSELQFWPEARIPYTTSDNFRERDHAALNAAIADYHEYTCLRFVPRTNEEAYMRVFMSLNLTRLCGSAEYCYNGKDRGCEIGGPCSGKNTFIHELGHVVCLEHEQVRVDRNDYLDLSHCTKPENIESIIDSQVTRTNFYDHLNHMHYPCYDCVGKPKMRRAICERGDKLGVLDAEKLNEYYNCQGCYRHRWYAADKLTSQEQSTLVNFASQPGDQGPVYLCRGYRDATLMPGRCLAAEKACYITDDGKPQKITERIQLFGLPGGSNTISNATSEAAAQGYALFKPPPSNTQQPHLIRMGRDFIGLNIFVGITWLVGEDGQSYTAIGMVREESWSTVEVPTPAGLAVIYDEPEKDPAAVKASRARFADLLMDFFTTQHRLGNISILCKDGLHGYNALALKKASRVIRQLFDLDYDQNPSVVREVLNLPDTPLADIITLCDLLDGNKVAFLTPEDFEHVKKLAKYFKVRVAPSMVTVSFPLVENPSSQQAVSQPEADPPQEKILPRYVTRRQVKKLQLQERDWITPDFVCFQTLTKADLEAGLVAKKKGKEATEENLEAK